jgi:hypothetical protein
VGQGEYKKSGLRGIQKSRLSIPDNDLQHFLDFARDQKVLIDQLQDAGADQNAIAEAVRAARDTLLRTLDPDVWTKIRKDAERTRRGIVFTFPPSAEATSK